MGTLQSNPIIQSEKPTQNIESKPAFTSDNHSYEVFRFFSVDPFANKDPYVFKQINEISNWAKDGSKDMGDALWKIRKMENKLGIPANGETRYTKMYNYIKMAKITQSLEKERNMQLERAKAQRQSQIDKIRREKERELKELEKQRNKELKQLNRQHSNILKPLYKIRSAFERGV